mgnify:CR=1 FL=1
MSVFEWGSTYQEIYENYGIKLNYVDEYSDEIIENDVLSVFYLMDSSTLRNPKDNYK